MSPLELLAPARNADIGIAAIRCGADAVYIGGPGFGARVAAGNSIADIQRLCSFASGFGVRIFVTVNTLARDEAERRQVVEMMISMKGIGISAFILQDATLLPLLKAVGPWDEEFHASTQCAIRTPERALQLVQMGFSRLILERQLSLEQIRAIRKAVPDHVELEAFVHGALCVCYSGDCYLSEQLTGRSANRGECAQPCRNLYDLVDETGKVLVSRKPLLSLKDLSLAGRIEDLIDAGVTSFKIEGRLKNESYVKNVVKAYSEILDRVIAGRHDGIDGSGDLVRESAGRHDGIDGSGDLVRESAGRHDGLGSSGGLVRESAGRHDGLGSSCGLVRESAGRHDGLGSSCGLVRASWGRVSGGFTPDLDKTFNRGYTSLFLDGLRGQWNSGDAAGGLGEPVGKFEGDFEGEPARKFKGDFEGEPARKFKRNSEAGANPGRGNQIERTGNGNRLEHLGNRNGNLLTIELLDGISLHNGDGLCHVNSQGEIVGFRIEKVIREGREGPGRFVQILVADNAQTPRPGSKIWRNYDCDFERALEKNMPSRVLSVTLSLSFTDDSLNAQAQCEDRVLQVQAQREDEILMINARREDGVCVEKDFDLSGLPLAQNQARMKEMIVAQLSKKSDNLEFSVENLAFDIDGGLPLMSAAFLNSIRRDLAAEFAGIRVMAKTGTDIPGQTNVRTCLTDIPGQSKAKTCFADIPDKSKAKTCFADIPDKSNVDSFPGERTENTSEPNHLTKLGNVTMAEQTSADLIHPRREGELMRSKYCIRAELGICLKNRHENNNPKRTCSGNASQLFLKNNGKTFPLHFDCSNCEMVVACKTF